MTIDGFRFLDAATRRVMKAWLDREPTPADIPWTPLVKPLRKSRVALISSAGISRLDDVPFDQEGERKNPWWGDPTHRVIPRETKTEDVRIDHLHIDPRPGQEDLDCVLPLRRLDELVEAGTVGSSAQNHYSIMGYILETEELVEETAPRIAVALAADQVDLALLVPV
jgi:D-proline reductase (dithiol) PrdB